MALPVDLPSDGGVHRANLIVARSSGGGARVLGDLLPHVSVDDHAAEEVGVVVFLVVHHSEHLRLNTDLAVGVERCSISAYDPITAKDAIVEGGLVLVRSSAGTYM